MNTNYEQLSDRVRNIKLRNRITSPEMAASAVKDGATLATSGMARAGYPKAFPLALADRGRAGEKLQINLYTGASVGEELDGQQSKKDRPGDHPHAIRSWSAVRHPPHGNPVSSYPV